MLNSIDSGLLKRLISSIVLVSIALISNWTGGVVLFVFTLILSYVLLYEFYKVTNINYNTFSFYFTIAIFTIVLLISYSNFYILSFIPLLMALIFLGIFSKHKTWSALAVVYLLPPLTIMLAFREHVDVGIYMIFWCFIIVWSADCLSYVLGRSIGGPLLWKSISPNKTWSGFIGGLLGATIIGYYASYLMPFNISYAAILSMLCALIVALGDLLESWLKRKFNKKDSSNFIPGHGGFLDRLDGFLFAIVFIWIITIMGWV